MEHLEKAFGLLEKYTMKLNPPKYCFGVVSEFFLGYLVMQRRIKANKKQIQAILNIKSATSVKEVQKITGRIAALNHFIPMSSVRSRHFTRLKKFDNFEWTPECKEALQHLKYFVANPPPLLIPIDGETLYMYLAVAEGVVSAVLSREEKGKQRPIYYSSKALLDAETRYSLMEKPALAIVSAARKMRPYFQCHPVVVRTRHPL